MEPYSVVTKMSDGRGLVVQVLNIGRVQYNTSCNKV